MCGFDSGSVNLLKEMKVGYLSQIDFVKGNTVIEKLKKHLNALSISI